VPRPVRPSPSSSGSATSSWPRRTSASSGFLGGLNAFFLLLAKPATYGLPDNPKLPQKNIFVESLLSIGSALLVGVGALVAFRQRSGGKEE
jgi:hypothetical protein